MTDWKDLYPPGHRPDMAEVGAYAESPLWPRLQAYLLEAYGAEPRLEYSRCGLEPGWNVKFKKGSRSLCTVYLRRGFVTAMVAIGPRDQEAAERALLTCTAETRELYRRTASSKLGRWLMIDVTSPEALEDVKALLLVRARPVKQFN